ncbi:hypothetical protein RBU49_18000 [Clostridium sp. MB40-C1]|nr:hypothetical protein [Clostridium sp. MB40-C1]WMJ80669.1 hypothetical protein RBU49_18000 [Clostridium sp. MB40-C1]
MNLGTEIIVPMVDPNQNGTVIDRIKSMRSLIENRMSKTNST